MSKVFVLGSGFSAAAGLPLARDLLKEIFAIDRDDFYVNQLKTWLETHFFQREANWIDNNNFGEILSRLDLIQYYKPLKDANYEIIANTEKKLLDLFAKTLNKKNLANLPEAYNIFATNVSYDDTIITFNHDMLMETTFVKNGMSYDYMLNNHNKGSMVPLLKMHGSVNMNFCPSCHKVYIEKQVCNSCKVALNLMIVAPTFFKSYEIPFLRQIWFVALQALIKSKELIFIGYSLHKEDILSQQLFDFGYRLNPDIKVKIINGPRTDIKIHSNIFGPNLYNSRLKFEEYYL